MIGTEGGINSIVSHDLLTWYLSEGLPVMCYVCFYYNFADVVFHRSYDFEVLHSGFLFSYHIGKC